MSFIGTVVGALVALGVHTAGAQPSVCAVKATGKVMAGTKQNDFAKEDCAGKCSSETELKGLWVAAGGGPKVRVVRREETVRVRLVGEGWMQTVSDVVLDAGFPKQVAKPGGLGISGQAEQPNVFEIPLAWRNEVVSVFSGYSFCYSDPEEGQVDSPYAVLRELCESSDPKQPRLFVWRRGAIFAQHGDTYYGGGDRVAAATNGTAVVVASARKDISDQDAPRCILEVVSMDGASAARSERLRVLERCGKSNHTTLPADLWDNVATALDDGGTSVTAFTQDGKIHLATLPPPDVKANVAPKAVIRTVGPGRGRIALAFDTTLRGAKKKIFLAYVRPDGMLILTRLTVTEPEKVTDRVAIKGAREPSIVVTGDRAYAAWIRNGAAHVADLVALLERKRVAPTQVSAHNVRASLPTLATATENGRLWMVWGESPTSKTSPNIHAAMLECAAAVQRR